MNDRSISATTICAIALWVAGFVLVIIYIFTERTGLGVLAVYLAAGAGTLTVRGYLIHLAENLMEREQNAFEIGRDSRRIRGVE